MSPTSPSKQYWDRKIRLWESSVYQQATAGLPWLERVATHFRRPVQARMAKTVEILTPWIAGKTVVDLGCGSGILAEQLLRRGASWVVGLDIAPSAIAAARQRMAMAGVAPDRYLFREQDLVDDPRLPTADLIVGLGFLDYLTPPQTVRFFRALSVPYYWFSFPEWRWQPVFLLHELYLRAAGCPVFCKYTPKAFEAVLALAGRGADRRWLTTPENLRFLHNLPSEALAVGNGR